MSRCIHVYSFVARNHGGIPFSGVCPFFIYYIVRFNHCSTRGHSDTCGLFVGILVSEVSEISVWWSDFRLL